MSAEKAYDSASDMVDDVFCLSFVWVVSPLFAIVRVILGLFSVAFVYSSCFSFLCFLCDFRINFLDSRFLLPVACPGGDHK